MKKVIYLQNYQKLIIVFGIIISFFLGFGLFTLTTIQNLSHLTDKIYNHPLVVSNASLQVSTAITKMHRSMKDVVLFDSKSDVDKFIRSVSEEESNAYKYLDIMRLKILGEEGQRLEKTARNQFANWKPIRSEVIELVENGDRKKAAIITVGKGAKHVALLEKNMQGLTNYARNKATDFIELKDKRQKEAMTFLILFLTLSIGTSLFISFFILKQNKKSEKKLRKSIIDLDESIKAGHVGLWDWNLITNKVNYSAEWKRQIGCDEHEIGNDFSEWENRVHPDDLKPTIKIVEKCIKDVNQDYHVEFRFRHKNGSYRWIFSQGSLFQDENGHPIRLVGSHLDITDQKLEEKRYRTTIESSIDGYWMVDSKANFLDVNDAYSRMIGYSRDELLKMSIMDVEANKSLEEIKERTKNIIRDGSARFESKHQHKNGHIIDVEISISYFQETDGLFFVFLRDITKRNQMEKRLRQSQKMESIGTLAGGIAHDFNNMLYPIIGFTEMTIMDLGKDHPALENLEDVLDGAKRARDLVKRILLFARQEEQDIKPILLKPVIKETMKLLRSSIPANIKIQTELYDGEDYILCDATEIYEIVMNLCTNAYHAMENRGDLLKVSLNIKEPDKNLNLTSGKYICMSISDNGTGIPEEILNKIFDPYYTTKEIGKGSGLGLSLVHGIVANYKGDIHIETSHEGTVFNVFLPVTTQSSETEHDQEDQQSITGTETILFVDDEKSILKLGVKSLETLGYTVTEMQDSSQALQLFKSDPERYDLVITDMAMPGMVGTELIKRILEIRSNTPVILCSGYSDKIDKKKAKELNIKAFIGKPVLINELRKKVRQILDQVKRG
ncbi:MAG: PAS domain S-box protein [Desulfobacteraceae bacterium]|nr:PAS domain S-box protein [Desulfobacteraceae bacterium]